MSVERGSTSRRQLLAATGIYGVAALAGCTRGGGPDVDYTGGTSGDQPNDDTVGGAGNDGTGSNGDGGASDGEAEIDADLSSIPGFDEEGFVVEIEERLNERMAALLDGEDVDPDELDLNVGLQSIGFDGENAICEYQIDGPAGPEIVQFLTTIFSEFIVDAAEFETHVGRGVFIVHINQSEESLVYDMTAVDLVEFTEDDSEVLMQALENAEPLDETQYG